MIFSDGVIENTQLSIEGINEFCRRSTDENDAEDDFGEDYMVKGGGDIVDDMESSGDESDYDTAVHSSSARSVLAVHFKASCTC